jgi:hypothetical protein
MSQRTCTCSNAQRCVDHMLELPAGLQEFVERYGRPGVEVKRK